MRFKKDDIVMCIEEYEQFKAGHFYRVSFVYETFGGTTFSLYKEFNQIEIETFDGKIIEDVPINIIKKIKIFDDKNEIWKEYINKYRTSLFNGLTKRGYKVWIENAICNYNNWNKNNIDYKFRTEALEELIGVYTTYSRKQKIKNIK